MLILSIILIITLVSLVAFIWGGTFFFQGYVYTEPSPSIFWQAPVLAALLTFGYAIWCFSVAFSSGASPSNIPINTIFSFSDKEEMLRRPAPKLWAITQDRKKQEEKPVEYVAVRGNDKLHPDKFQYFHDPFGSDKHPWFGTDVVAIEIQPFLDDATKKRFNDVPPDQGFFGGKLDLVDTKRLRYREFRSEDGWAITEYENGPTGLPIKRSWGRFLLNIFFNAGHFGAWFLGLWLVLRYQWLHALGLGMVMWLIMTLLILPMMLGYAGEVSESRRSGQHQPGVQARRLPHCPIFRNEQGFPRPA